MRKTRDCLVRLAGGLALMCVVSMWAHADEQAGLATVSVSVRGDRVTVNFSISASLVPSQWHGDPEKPSSRPPYVRKLGGHPARLFGLDYAARCHQDSSSLTLLSIDLQTGKRQTIRRDWPAVLDGRHTVRIVHELHCDAIDSEPLKWVMVNVFDLLPDLTSLRVRTNVNGNQPSSAPTALTPQQRRLPLVPIPPP